MADETPVTLLPGSLPYECYPELPQTLNVDIVTRIQAFLSEAFPGIYVGPTAPPVDQRNRLWFNTATNSFRWYQYVNGDWMRVYEIPASSDAEWIWKGTEANLKTFAGGDTNALGDYSGPLWEIDHEIDGRVLVGAGDVPGSSPAASIAQGAIVDSNGAPGAYQVSLVPANFQHFHGAGTDGGNDDPPTMLARAWSSVKNFTRRINDLNTTGSSGWHDDTTALGSGTMGTTEPYADPNFAASDAHANMPQFRARYVIKRTARIWVRPPY